MNDDDALGGQRIAHIGHDLLGGFGHHKAGIAGGIGPLVAGGQPVGQLLHHRGRVRLVVAIEQLVDGRAGDADLFGDLRLGDGALLQQGFDAGDHVAAGVAVLV